MQIADEKSHNGNEKNLSIGSNYIKNCFSVIIEIKNKFEGLLSRRGAKGLREMREWSEKAFQCHDPITTQLVALINPTP